MRAANNQRHPVMTGGAFGRRGFQPRPAGQRQPLRSLKRVGQAEQILVGKCPAKQGNARGQAVRHKSARHAHRGVVQQVHKVGVIPEIGVARDRFRLQLVERHRTRIGWRQHAVEGLEDRVAPGFVLL